MDLLGIRRTVVAAIASDEMLVELLVLKGGNALEIVYKIGNRSSLDLDYSVENDFEDPDEIARRLNHAITERFDASGFHVFDFTFRPRPASSLKGSKWGGYNADFKIISRKVAVKIEPRPQEHAPRGQTNRRGTTRKFTGEIARTKIAPKNSPTD